MAAVAREAHAGARTRVRVALYGAVQGVGFRPFVYRLATDQELTGWVLNSGAGLLVEAEGPQADITRFLERLDAECPPSAVVLTREVSLLDPAGYEHFEIRHSESSSAPNTSVLPDLATCPECLSELLSPDERRYGYPFTNCTLCGPRYTIITDIPYDRPHTTLRAFTLCESCRREYTSPHDRRFHAQPIACPKCGPQLRTTVADAADALARGEIVALKGIGGFQLLADARSGAAVARLRERKKRDAKPFAVMMPDLEAVRRYCFVSEAEQRLLQSAAAPIVLLELSGAETLPGEVSGCSPWLGVMLPYSPLHHLLLRTFPHPIVATSGNRSGDPIAIDDDEAAAAIGNVADRFVTHDRPIARPCDDSVVRVSRGRECVLRRARGYAPLPVRVRRKLLPVLAVGAHLKNAVAIARGHDVYLSQHIGDLDTLASQRVFENAIDDLCRLYRFQPELVACDLHPDYASTQWARASGLPVATIQHHHAHAAACAAENDLTEDHLSVVWDGSGYGFDGTIWGGELFACEAGARYERVGHLRPFRLPGGEAAVREGWRVAASLRWELGLGDIPPLVARMLERSLNCPVTSSVGRLFDAVAALTGVAEENRFEGQAGMLLERSARASSAPRNYQLTGGDWRPLIEAIWRDIRAGIPACDIAAGFHHALATWIAHAAEPWRHVTLSGGVFQNSLLTEVVVALLESRSKRVYTHQRIPPNDGGIALGQAVLA